MYDKRIQWIYRCIDTIISLARVILLSHFKKTKPIGKQHDKCVILGNGPSLLDCIDKIESSISDYDIIAINHIATTPLYEKYKPSIYILADPIYWNEKLPGIIYQDNYTENFYDVLIEKTTWDLQLYLPYKASKVEIIRQIKKNPHINISFYNNIRFESFLRINYFFFDKQFGLPSAGNIMCVSLILAIYSKYKNIYISGADHDWSKYAWVDENNKVRYVQNHGSSLPNDIGISNIRLHDSFMSFYRVFKAYDDIENYARNKNIKIFNLSKTSFIDSFEKI